MSDKLSLVPKGATPHVIPTADDLLAGISRLVGHVSVSHERSDNLFSASASFQGQFISARGPSPRQALWALAKMMNALR